MSNTVLVSEDVKAEIMAEAKTKDEIMTELARLTIDSPEALEIAGEGTKIVKGWWKEFEERRTAVTKPINAALREVNGWFKPIQAKFEAAEQDLKRKMTTYTLAQRKAQEEAMRAAAVAVQAGDADTAASYIGALAPAPVAQGVSIRKVWKHRVVDAAKVPREFLMVNDAAIVATIPKTGSPEAIPGVEFFEDGIVTVRS